MSLEDIDSMNTDLDILCQQIEEISEDILRINAEIAELSEKFPAQHTYTNYFTRFLDEHKSW